MRPVTIGLALATLLAIATVAWARPPAAELAGVRIGMREDRAHAVLAKRGTRGAERAERDREEEQETWTLRSGPWAYVTFGVSDARVHWITAFARPAGPRVRYRDLGPLPTARRSGRYYVMWQVPAAGGTPAYSIVARGTDSTYVKSVSLSQAGRQHREAAEPDSAR